MDPLSIAASVTALATLCGQILILCNHVAGRQQSIRRTLTSLRTEIFAYQVSLYRIQDLLLDQTGSLAKYLSSNNEWTESFDTALSGCSLTASILFGELQKAIDSSTGSSIRFTLKESEINDLIGELRGQQASIQLLIQTLQLNSITDIYQLLEKERTILLDAKKQTTALSEIWGVPNPGSGLRSDTFSILSLDPDDQRFDFDEELSRMGPYRRALLSQREKYQQAPHPIANLIDDDLLDLSIEPLNPGPWVQALHQEFVTEIGQQQNDENVEHLGQEPLEESLKVLEEAVDKQVSDEKSIEEALENRDLDTSPEDRVIPALETEDHHNHAKASISSGTLIIDNMEPFPTLQNSGIIGKLTTTSADILETNTRNTVSKNTLIEGPNELSPAATSSTPVSTALEGPILLALKDDFDIVEGYLVPQKLDFEELVTLKKDAPLHYAAYIGNMRHKTRWQGDLRIESLYKNRTALSYAAIAGNVQSLRDLVQGGASIDGEGPFGFSALHWAIVHGHLTAVKILMNEKRLTEPCLAQNRETNIFEGWTPLVIAAHFGHLDIVRYLLQIKAVTKQRYSPAKRLLPPLHAAVASVPYLLMSRSFKQPFSCFNPQDLLKLSLPKPELLQDRGRQHSPEIDLNRKFKIVELLFKAGLYDFNIDGIDTVGLTALQAASCGTSPQLVKYLLQKGAKIEAIKGGFHLRTHILEIPSTLNHRDGPLHLATYWNRASIVEVLLRLKANPNASGVKNRTPLHHAAIIGSNKVIKLLVARGASVDSNTFDYQNGVNFELYKARTPLLSTLIYQKWDSARLLIALGATLKPFYRPLEVPFRDSWGLSDTILIFILKQKMPQRFMATKVLLEAGASLHETDSRGNKPLNALAMNASALPLEYDYLLEKGADPNSLDSAGIAPLQQVIMTGSEPGVLPKVVRILLKWGADPSLKNKHYVNALTRADSLYDDLVHGKVHLNHNIDDLREVTWILGAAKTPADFSARLLCRKQPTSAIEQGVTQ